MRTEFVKRLEKLAETDPSLFFITGDLGFGVLDEFSRKFPRQYLNVGVAEQNMIGVAAGLALEGRRVFVYSIGNFPTLRCLEQIRNDVLYHRLNVKIVSIGGGFSYGQLGFSHHATEDLSILRSLPGMTVVSPGDLWEAGEATEAVFSRSGPCYLRLDKSSAGHTEKNGEIFEIGKARQLRDGRDATLVASGGILEAALKAAESLDAHGIRCRVLSMHTIKPLDLEALENASRETGGLVTVEEHVVEGGLGGAVAEACLEGGFPPLFFHRIGIRSDYPDVVGSQSFLRERCQMGAKAIHDKVASLVTDQDRGRRPAGRALK
jgi:transketolase